MEHAILPIGWCVGFPNGMRSYGLEGVLAASLLVHIVVTLFTSGFTASKILGSFKPMLAGIMLSFSLMLLALFAAGWLLSHIYLPYGD